MEISEGTTSERVWAIMMDWQSWMMAEGYY